MGQQLQPTYSNFINFKNYIKNINLIINGSACLEPKLIKNSI